MDFGTLVSLIKNVMLSPEVIIITIALILYLKLVFYVVWYKKPAMPSFEARIKKNLKPQQKTAAASHTKE
ncbi:MAG: hypothetical protein ACTTH8_05175 [Treponema sp.]